MMSVLKEENIYKWKILYGFMMIHVKGKRVENVQIYETKTKKPFQNPYHEHRVLSFLPKWADKMGFEIAESCPKSKL
jgi:hypothetical protein